MAIQQTSAVTGKTATIQDRELDNAIRDIQALNEQGSSPSTPNLQDVLTEGNTSSVGATFEDENTSTILNPDGIGGFAGPIINTWAIDNATGQAQFVSVSDSFGPLRPNVASVSILSSEILTIGDEPIDLLSYFPQTIQAGEYYQIDRITIKNKPQTTPYNSERLYVYGVFMGITESNILGNDQTVTIMTVPSQTLFDDSGTFYTEHRASLLNSGLFISTYSGNNPTSGDGDIELVIDYRIMTF